MVRLWTWEALAHGAEVVSYFRWRQAPFAQEQFHAGLNMAGLDELSPGGQEAATTGQELAAFSPLPATAPAKVAIIFDYASYWATMVQPQGRDFRYEELVFRWYEALRRLGLDIDVVAPGQSLQGYALVVAPCLMQVDDATLRALKNAPGLVLIGPRSGSRDRHFGIPADLPPGPLAGLTGARVIEVGSLRPALAIPVSGEVSGEAIRWHERLQVMPDTEIAAHFTNGDPALLRRGGCHYLACWPDPALLSSVMKLLSDRAGLETLPLPEAIRLRRRGDLTFFFNYGEESWPVPTGFIPTLGARDVPPQGLVIARHATSCGIASNEVPSHVTVAAG